MFRWIPGARPISPARPAASKTRSGNAPYPLAGKDVLPALASWSRLFAPVLPRPWTSGFALSGFINVLDPEIVVLGGGIADANEALFDPLQAHLDEFEWRPGGARVRLAKAALGRNAGAAGAAYGAKLAAIKTFE